ncbi:lasso peptide biosynthesis B2 protein [Sphingomicrobium aestuariivivum]|uniref:lasso peptide biosynthesis B2 protein n=1 Tax=Sphingomicrobium aestuariivivum TaxID=1582356 RepID=UPI001FD64BED|nr:lasso peptide biosynthesis B2 protein [Sphingomicrobium aestuariivivum]MCJ8191363.1 lasso peptide biosynthesis B2 protein [Sphingomicrobium aestuariivivum]
MSENPVRRLPARVVIEALGDHLAAAAALRSRPFEALVPTRQRHRPGATMEERDLIERATRGWARRLPWKTECFIQAIVAMRMLERRRRDVLLHYGTRRGVDGLEAHVWVSSGELPVVGHRNAHEFVEIARFPPQKAAAGA